MNRINIQLSSQIAQLRASARRCRTTVFLLLVASISGCLNDVDTSHDASQSSTIETSNSSSLATTNMDGSTGTTPSSTPGSSNQADEALGRCIDEQSDFIAEANFATGQLTLRSRSGELPSCEIEYYGDVITENCCSVSRPDFVLDVNLNSPLVVGTYIVGENGVSAVYRMIWDHRTATLEDAKWPEGQCVCTDMATRKDIAVASGRIIVREHENTGVALLVETDGFEPIIRPGRLGSIFPR